MISNIIIVLFLLTLSENASSILTGRLYAVNQTAKSSWFGMIENESKNFDEQIELGEVWYASGPCATRSINSEQYTIVYLRDTVFHPLDYHLLTIDVTNSQKPKILNDITLDKSINGSFLQISDDDKQFIGIKTIVGTRAQIELATINKTTGQINVMGFYPYGGIFIEMNFVRQHRLFYVLHDSKLIYGINVDTGNVDVDIVIPNGYSLQGLIYDSIKDRLLTFAYSENYTQPAFALAEIVIKKNSTNFQIQPIGNPIIPSVGYAWFFAYAVAVKERQWISLWMDDETSEYRFISVDLDNGSIVTNQTMKSVSNLIGLVYFQ